MKQRLSSIILIGMLLAWIGISIFRTGYNFSKLVTEEKKWYFLSDEQKRALQFGDLHFFLRYVQSHTKEGSNILFFTDDSKVYYLSRYYLYPTKRMGRPESFLWNSQTITYDYYMIYPANHEQLMREPMTRPDVNKFKESATYHGQNGEIGIIYKK